MWWMLIPAALVALIAVLILRACAFRPRAEEQVAAAPVEFDGEKAVAHLQEMIRCKTVSYRDESLEDAAEFEKFRELLKTLYPQVHARCEYARVGRSGVLYHLKGESDAAPCVFMSHYDVVPANEDAWQKPAFDAVIEDGVLWGRGTLDTKATLLGVLESAETLLAGGFVPKNDLYFSFAGDEEVAGVSAPAIVDELERRGVRPALVVDEGGAVVEGMFPGVKAPCALVGTGEKGMLDLEFRVRSNGGHASAPPPHTPVGVLSKACVAVENHPFPCEIAQPAAEMFDTLGRHSTFAMRLIFANLWLFKPVLNAMCKKQGGEMNALMRTTVAFTQMEGSRSSNVLPPEARMVANLRLTGSTTPDSAIEYLRGVVKDPSVELNMIYGMNPSRFSDTSSAGWQTLKTAIAQTWAGAIVSPYLMVACSDSRHFCRISDNVFRFSAMALSPEERGTIHGNDERVPVEKVKTVVAFYLRLMQQC